MNRIACALVIALGLISLMMLSSCGGGSSAQHPVLSISVASLPDGTVGTAYSQTISALNGTSPFQWSVSSGFLPDQLALSSSASNSVVISGMPDIKQAAVKFTIQVKDSKGQTASTAYTVNINNPAAPTINASSAPSAGTVTVSYSSTFTATGGLAPLIWSESGALPAGLALANNGTLFGRPAAAGSFPITVTVTDNLGQTDSKQFTVVTNPSGISNARLSGHYAFVFQGFLKGSGSVFDLAGSFVADGAGGINGGHIDRNGVGESPVSNTTFTGTYSFDATDQGTIEIKNTGAGLDTIFRFVTRGPAGSPATSATIVEYDNVGFGTGTALRQHLAGFSSSITNDYIFQLSGTTTNGSHAAAAGRFKADGVGGVSNAVMDVNVAGAVFLNTPFTLTYSVPTGFTSGRGTATLKVTLGGSPITLDFTIYVISATEAYLIGSDTVTDSVPLYYGATAQQTGAPFTKASMNGTYVYMTQGSVTSGANAGFADSSAGLVTMDAGGNFSQTGDENMASSISQPSFSGTYDVDPNGRVTLTGGAHPPVMYLSGDVGFILGTDDDASGGTFQKQTQDSVEKSTLNGTVAYFSTIEVVSLWNITSETAFSGGMYNGYWDVGIGYFFPQTNIYFTGDYKISANGRGIANATSQYPEAFYVVGKNTFVLLGSIGTTDKWPGLVIGTCQQTSTAGFGSCP